MSAFKSITNSVFLQLSYTNSQLVFALTISVSIILEFITKNEPLGSLSDEIFV